MFRRISTLHLVVLATLLLILTACGTSRTNWAGLSVGTENDLYVAHDRFIARLDATGGRVWTYPPSDDRKVNFYAAPTITEEVIYAGDYTGGVHAINRETGEEIWVYTQSGTKLFGFLNFGGSSDRVIGSVTVGDEVIYVPDELGVFVLDKATGKRLDTWNFETQNRAVWSQPLLIEGEPDRLFVTSLDHYIYSLDPQTGDVLWKQDLGGAAPGTPAFDPEANLLFVGTFAGELLAISAEDGSLLAEYKTQGWLWDAPALVDETLYFGDLEGYLYALEFADGDFQEIWSKKITSGEGKFRATPLVTDDLLIIGSNQDVVYGVSRTTGSIAWENNLGYEVISNLLQVQGEEMPLVVTATEDNEELVIALRLDNGNKTWRYEHKDEE